MAPVRRERKRLPDSGTRISGLAGGGQKAVVKVVSFASGSARVGALASYVTKEREGGVATEDQDGLALDSAAVVAKLARWSQGYSERQPSKDVATVRFEVAGRAGLDVETVQTGFGRAFEGYRFALRVERAGEGGFEVTAVVAAAGDPALSVAGAKAQPRFKFDKAFEASLAAGIARGLGAEVQAQVLGTGHGREGALHRLSLLVAGGAALDERGRELSTVDDVRAAADAWRKGLGSRQARDAMHFVVSAKAGTDPTAFRSTARELLASEFAGHEYLFAVHNDRGHLHAHAVILVKGEDGQRIRPDISTFAAWRSRYAEIAESHGIRMVATRRSDTASAPAFSQGEAALTDRGVAPDHIRRKVVAKRGDAIHVPVREEGRACAVQAYQAWKALETTSEAPQARSAAGEQLTRLATAVSVSHAAAARADGSTDMQEKGAAMARARSEYLTAEFKRANDVLNRALPLLEGADKVEATERANAYLASLAKQVEAVEAVERGQVAERAHGIRIREEREAIDANGEARSLKATAIEAGRPRGAETSPETASEPEAAMLEEAAARAERVAGRERPEAEAMAREERALRANPNTRVQIDPNLPHAGEELREEHELLIDRLEAQKLTYTRVHRR
ncbi:relaxase/mobilization nuclease domain-containing protein [uncultured Enterovirga sp.]|uniref:relaxase/mobilization nuclease domain-containing protein n=1 Tax=uncultured Enterovirga sp. TaxID=2026352 RepID=UPI0035C98209